MENRAITQAISEITAGNNQAFGVIYDTFIDQIYSFVYYRTSHTEIAEDLTSQVFLKALEKIHQFSDKDTGSFSAWLYTIARNTVYDHYRTDKKMSDIDALWDMSSSEDVSENAAVSLSMQQVRDALSKLSAEQQDIIVMRLWDGLTHSEIAAITGKTEASVKMIFSRSMRELRQHVPHTLLLLLILKHLL